MEIYSIQLEDNIVDFNTIKFWLKKYKYKYSLALYAEKDNMIMCIFYGNINERDQLILEDFGFNIEKELGFNKNYIKFLVSQFVCIIMRFKILRFLISKTFNEDIEEDIVKSIKFKLFK